jgi:hypothetical protein
MLDILRAALPRFSERFIQELKVPTADNVPIVRALILLYKESL